ncbi:MAG TPA: histidine kinase [Solirubrobacteraceae bacterium]|nr:histidine kinase [Solirubrobacteraceae bacterium]
MRPGSPRSLVVLSIVGAATVAGGVALVLTSDHEANEAFQIVAGGIVAPSFMGTGLFAWWRRPHNHTGLLMYAVGVAFLLAALKDSNAPAVFGIGIALSNLFIAVLAHLLVAFPTGRLEGRVERRLVGLFYGSALVGSAVPVLFTRSCGCTTPHPRDVFLIAEAPAVATAVEVVAGVGLIVAAAGIAVLLVRRWLASSGAQRRIIAPVLWTGAALVAAVSLLVLLQVTGAPTAAQNAVTVVSAATIAAVPFAFLAGLLRMRTTRADIVGGLVGNLESAGSSIRETIATALGDPSLELIYWRAEKAEYVTADGGPARLPTGDSSRAVAEIERDGRPIAAMIFDATLADEPELIAAVSSAGALALDNERLQAELRARIAELEESRARVLDAELAERRRIERDLHDGAQQRFVSLSMTLALLDRGLAGAGAARQLLASAREQLDLGLGELRELARGIHPALLTERGLAPAIEALAARAPLDVRVLEVPDERLPAQVETAAYFIVSESLTNAAKHASAAAATVRIGRANGTAVVEVSDDGVGGADPTRGSGLRGLVDRLAALDGALEVESPTGGGTRVQARIPCA